MSSPTSAVLVIEDDDAIRNMLVAALRRTGLDVQSARNGEEALQLLESQRVILLDLMLPRVDGWTVLREIFERVKPRPIVIVMTAGVPLQQPLDPPPDLLVSKPFDLHALIETVVNCTRMPAAPGTADSTKLPAPGKPQA